MTDQDLIQAFFTNGGRIKHVKPGTPKDLKRIKRGYGLFGGKHRYAATIAKRQDQGKGDLFQSVSKPQSTGKSFKYSF
jgi:hypothetical protein